jgi:hypothetical protein
MGWLWGNKAKDINKELDLTLEPQRDDLLYEKVVIHLETKVGYPIGTNLVDNLVKMSVNLKTNPDLDIKNIKLKKVELLGEEFV